MSEVEETEFDEAAYTKELEAKVKEINAYLEVQYTKMSEYVIKEVSLLHRKYCKLQGTLEAEQCEREFTRAFLTVLEIDGQRMKRRSFGLLVEVEEVSAEKDDGHVHEPAPDVKEK